MHVQEKSHVNMRPLFLMPASSPCPFLASERSRRPPQASSPRVSSPFSPCCPWLLPPRRPPRHGHPPGPPCGTLSTLSTRTARPAGAVDEPGSAARFSHRSFSRRRVSRPLSDLPLRCVTLSSRPRFRTTASLRARTERERERERESFIRNYSIRGRT